MLSAKVRVEQGTVRETYSPSAWGRAICKYSVDFEINGELVPGSTHTMVAITATVLIRKERAFSSSWRS
jgi:hypothetical protein